MSDDLVLTLLRATRADMGEMKADIVEIKARIGMVAAQYSSLSRRVDRIGGDVEIIKRRFDVAEARWLPSPR